MKNFENSITCPIGPISIIGTSIIIQKTSLKPFSSHTPVNAHISYKKGTYNLQKHTGKMHRLDQDSHRRCVLTMRLSFHILAQCSLKRKIELVSKYDLKKILPAVLCLT